MATSGIKKGVANSPSLWGASSPFNTTKYITNTADVYEILWRHGCTHRTIDLRIPSKWIKRYSMYLHWDCFRGHTIFAIHFFIHIWNNGFDALCNICFYNCKLFCVLVIHFHVIFLVCGSICVLIFSARIIILFLFLLFLKDLVVDACCYYCCY